MTSFYGSVNGGGQGEIDTSTLMQKNDPTFNGTLTGPNAHFTGTVQIPEPTEDNHAATKAYVDAALADVDLSEVTTRMDAIETAQDELAAQLDDKVDAENPAFTGTATLNGKNVATIDQIPDINDLPYLDENNPTYTGTLTGENAAFSGTVTVATPTAEGEAANKGYVDSAKTELEGDINTLQQTVNTVNQQVTNITSGTEELPYLKNTGDSGTGVYDFTGATVNAADPTDNSNVATKHYVDQKVASAGGAGEVVSYTQGDGISISPENEISLSIDSAGANGLKVGANGLGLDLATDTTPGAMAASDKTAIASNTTEITNIKNGTTELPYLKETNPTYEGTLIGGDATFTGSVQISTPDQDNEAANKSYVDTAVAASNATIQQIQADVDSIEDGTTELPYVKKSGDTMSGSLTIGTTTINEFGVIQTDKIVNNGVTGNGYGIDFSGTPKIYNVNTNDFVPLSIGEPTATGHAATKKYVDDQIAAIDVEPLTQRVEAAEGEIDALQSDVGEAETNITNIINGTTELPYVKKSGDTVDGDYTFNGKVNVNKPTENANVTNKEYVDNTYNDISTLRNLYADGEIIIFTEEGKPLNLKLYGYSWFKGANSYCNISKKDGEVFQLVFHTGDEDKYIQLPDSLVLNGIDTRYMSDYDDQENAILNYKPIYFSADSNGEELDNFEIIADEYDFSTGKYIKKIGVIDSYNGEDLSKTVYTTYSIQNHTSEIAQTGETVFYLLNEPVETDIPHEIMEAYNQLQFHKGNTSLQLQGMMYSSIDFIYIPIEITFKIDKTNPYNNQFSTNRYSESNTLYVYGNPDAVFMMPDIYAENATIHDFRVEDDIYIYHNSRLSDYRYRIEGKDPDRGLKFTIQDDGGRDDLITLEIADPVYDNQAATKGYVDEAIEAIDVGNEIDALQTEISNIKDGTAELPYIKNTDDTVAKGNPAICNDSAEWPLQGMCVYGKSAQVSTTGAQLFDKGIISSPTSSGSVDYYPIQVGDGNFTLSSDIPLVDNISNLFLLAGSVNTGAGTIENGVYLNSPRTVTAIDGFVTVGYRTLSQNPNDPLNYNIMLNAGSTPLPYEPYTGGKPSPSPEYPQEIHSAGDEGEIGVGVTGENILNPDWINDTNDNILFSCRGLKPGNYTISFVSTADWWTNNDNNHTWYIHYYGENDEVEIGSTNITFADAAINVRSHGNFTIPQGTDKIRLNVYSGVTKASITDLMLNIGLAVLPYEPYQSQSLTFQTLNGLPGIPVDSGGNFVDADGQEWICDYRDWARGVDVKCVEIIAGPEITYINIGQDGGSWLTTGETIPFYVDYSQFNKPKSIANYGFCTYFTYNMDIVSYDNEGFFVKAGINYFAFRLLKSRLVEYGYDDSDQVGTGPSAFLAWLNAHNDLQIFYAVSSIETPIPSDELAAYKALHTYDGTTIISSTDSLAEIEFNYVSQNQANLPYIKNKGDIVSGEYDFTSANVKVAEPTENNNVATKNYVDEAINKFYHAQVLAATSKETVDNLFASWWKTKWVEGVTTYNSMLEDWFENVLYDDRIHGIKLPLWETSHSQRGEFTDDSIGLTCEISTDDYAGRDDFAYLPQFWCVEVAVEKNADYTHTIYACEFIDDINVVRAGGPNDGKHLVWVLQKNTYRREWEEEGYKYLKTRCTPAEGYTTWLQGTDNSGRVYPYVGIPKYAAGIEEDGTIGSRAGLKPAIFESYDSGIQKWRARGSQYTGGSYLTLKWQLDMIALKYASKGNSNGIEGCVNFNIQTPVLIAESNANRVIINQDQSNNFTVGQYINIGSGDRLASETNVLITNIETVNISETDYLALTFEGSPIETTTAQKVCSLAWPADLITNHIQGNDGQVVTGQTVTGLIQKTEFLNGAHLITSDEKWKWDAASNHEDGSRTFECYICEDANNITTGNSFENYTLAASINLPADYHNSSKYITDIVTTDKQIVFPKAVSNEAGSTTGYCDCMWIYFVDNAMRAPWHCGHLWGGSIAGLAQLASARGSSDSYWNGGVGAPGLAR